MIWVFIMWYSVYQTALFLYEVSFAQVAIRTMQSHKSIVPGALGRRWILRLFRVQKRQYFTPTFGDAHLKRHFESWKISSSISLHVCVISDWYKILPGCYSLLVVWNLKIPTHSGRGWVDVTAGLWKTDVTAFQVNWRAGSSNSDICDLRVCSWVGLYLRTLRFWRHSVGWSDKSLSQFEAREDTPHSVKLEGGVFFVGCAYRSRGVSMGFKFSSLSIGRGSSRWRRLQGREWAKICHSTWEQTCNEEPTSWRSDALMAEMLSKTWHDSFLHSPACIWFHHSTVYK